MAKFEKGFTLLELVIAVAIFLIILIILGGMVLTSIRFQRQAIATQGVQDTLRSALELMGREIRLAQKDTQGSCASPAYADYVAAASSITFLNDHGQCVRYYLDTTKQQIQHVTNGVSEPLTAESVNITSLNFDVLGDAAGTQPRVVIRLTAQSQSGASPASLTVETTLTQRQLNVQ